MGDFGKLTDDESYNKRGEKTQCHKAHSINEVAFKIFFDHNFQLPISIAELAFEASVSETYFRREFKLYFGLSPVAYIQKIRIENAKSLLLTGYYQVSEVAVRCGFDSISYFSTTFKKLCGITPTEYASQMRKNKE